MTVWLIAFYLLNWNAWTQSSYSNLELSELQPGEQTQGNRKWSGKHVTVHCGNYIVKVTIHLPPHDFLAAVSCDYHNDTHNEYIPLLGELQLTWPNLQLWSFVVVHFILASILGRSTSTCSVRRDKVWKTSVATAQNITLPNTNIIGNLQVYKFHCKPVSEHCIRHFDCFSVEPRASLAKRAEKLAIATHTGAVSSWAIVGFSRPS